MKKSISVVIPNYNGKKLLQDNLPAVYEALKRSGCSYEIIISDDASTDGSAEFIKKTFPEILLIESHQNAGFPVAINKAINKATKDLVLALNSDVILTPDYFFYLLPYFENKKTFGVMGRIIGIDNDELQDTAKYPDRKGLKINSTANYLPVNYKNEYPLKSLFLSGANSIMSREKLIELGGFDEIFSPYYFEDVELSLRAWRLGWQCFYEHRAICRHSSMTTISSYNKKGKIRIVSLTNRFVMHDIHLQGAEKIVWNVKIFINLLYRWITFRLEYYKAFANFIKKRKEISASKKRFRKLQKKYNSYITVPQLIKELRTEIKNIPLSIRR